MSKPTPTNCAWARSSRSKKAVFFTQPDGPGGFVRVQHMRLGKVIQWYWILENQLPSFHSRYAKEGLSMQRIDDMAKHKETAEKLA